MNCDHILLTSYGNMGTITLFIVALNRLHLWQEVTKIARLRPGSLAFVDTEWITGTFPSIVQFFCLENAHFPGVLSPRDGLNNYLCLELFDLEFYCLN